MIISETDFQCVTEIDDEGYITRYPSSLYNIMRKTAREFCNVMATNEIRLHIYDEQVILKVWVESSSIENMNASVFYGDHFAKTFKLEEGENIIVLKLPKLLEKLDSNSGKQLFHHRVARVFIPSMKLKFISISGKHRLPKAEQLPQKTMLSYGTSITQGIGATQGNLGYAKILANSLACDLKNFGIGSSAFCESEVVDYFAAVESVDLYLFELSVNMLNQGVVKDEFKKRVSYLLEIILKKQKPIILISPFKYFYNLGFLDDNPRVKIACEIKDYEGALKELVEEFNNENITFIFGSDISEIGFLAADLIHPSDMGNIEIARHIRERITIKG